MAVALENCDKTFESLGEKDKNEIKNEISKISTIDAGLNLNTLLSKKMANLKSELQAHLVVQFKSHKNDIEEFIDTTVNENQE